MEPSASRDEGRSKLRELIQGIDTAVLTTASTDGRLHSRPMATLDTDGEAELWFFTDDYTAKAKDVVLNPQVGVTYAEPQKNRFVSVSGTAELVHDRERARQLWRPELKSWFPRGLDDPELALLRVEIDDAQYWDAPASKLVQLSNRVRGKGSRPPAKSELPIKTRIEPDNLS